MTIAVEKVTYESYMLNCSGRLSPNQQDLVAFGQCIECGEDLEFEMFEDCRLAHCCEFSYSTGLLGGGETHVEHGEYGEYH